MKYLNRFNKIDEKLNWKHFLIMFGLTVNFIPNYKKYNNLKHVYSLINSPESNPTEQESKKLDKVRKLLIKNVRETNIFNKFNKEWVIDSLNNIKFKLVDKIDFANNELEVVDSIKFVGCYIPLYGFKSGIISKLAGEPKEDNIILIDRNLLLDSVFDLEGTLMHELYHYFDKLTDKQYQIDDSYLDKKVFSDTTYGLNKITNILTANNYNYDTLVDEEIKKDILSLYNNYKSNKIYYMSYSEVFARWNTFKSLLLKDGYIKNINEMPTKRDIYKYMYLKLYEDNLTVLLVLNWDKLNDIDNISIKNPPLKKSKK